MFGSKNDYFKKDLDILIKDREKLKYILKDIWNLENNLIKVYTDAFDYFILNPDSYDGATIVNDFWIIPGLDIWAMLHDYLYIKFNVAVNIKAKYYADLFYCQQMRNFKVSWGAVWLVRFSGLTLSGLFFIPREKFYNKKFFSAKQKKEFYSIILPLIK